MKNVLLSLWRALFGYPVRAFGVVSLLLLITLFVVPIKGYFSEWRHDQRRYLALIRGRSDAAALERRFHEHEGIQQIWLPQLGVVDRCTTCHVALKEPTLANFGAQPFRPHPTIPHASDEFGCVMCHRGQGLATSVEEAHGSTPAWDQPILPARYVQSSCGQCHSAPLTGTPQLNLGRSLLGRYGCVHCHTIKLPDGTSIKATDLQPSLEHIADKTTREWIYAWMKDTHAISVTATMPNYKFSDPDARDISAYLIASSTPLAGDTEPVEKTRSMLDSKAGASLYGKSFCTSCHAVQNAAGNLVGGDMGPELTWAGNKVKPEWLQAWLRNPRVYDPETAMPHYRFTGRQITLLAHYLESKADPDLLSNLHLSAATPEEIAHGKQLVTEYGCASCHKINGVKKQINFAPELTGIGSKPLTQIEFLPGMPHTLPDYIAEKIRRPRSFGSSVKMPPFSLAPAQIDALTTALLSITEQSHKLPAALIVPAQSPSSYQPAGKAGQLMKDLACFSCHTVNGRGGGMAPDLAWEGSAVQQPWLRAYLKNSDTLRPALIRRMPKFNLSDSDIAVLSDYILTVYQNPEFDRDSMPAGGYPAAQIEQGRQLFYSKYACQSCHIIDAKADKGYVGPTLTQVGSRMNAAWIYHWLKDPQAMRPGAIEPNRKMSDEDARALTAFLMAQKASGKREAKR